MPFTIEELDRSRKPRDGSSPANSAQFVIRGDPGETEESALAALRAAAPATIGTLKLRDCSVDRITDGWFYGSAEYGTGEGSQDKETGESSFAFDTSGGTFHITQAKAEIAGYAASGSAPSMNGVIGATPDGPEGVDITIPQYQFTETHYIAQADVTATYVGYLYSLTGTTNNASFKGLAIGEGLFLGARGSRRTRGDWEITFTFAGSPNITGLAIGSITGIAKKGWEYLWVWYEKKAAGSGANKILAPSPKFVYVDRVYDSADWSLLGIGTT